MRLWKIHRATAEVDSIDQIQIRYVNRLEVPGLGFNPAAYFTGFGQAPEGMQPGPFLHQDTLGHPAFPSHVLNLVRTFETPTAASPSLLGTRFIQRFIYYAGLRDYAAIRPVLLQMNSSAESKTVQTGARLCCLLALNVQTATQDAEQVRTGSPAMREAAARIYAANIAHKDVGATCRDLLQPFFADPEETVRTQAAHAFRHISELDTAEQSKLLAAFLDANPSGAALEPVIRALVGSHVRLPDLVCRLIETGVSAFKTEAGDIRTAGARIASDLSKIVIRLYTQSDDAIIRKRCLEAIDSMEHAGFFGLSAELGRIDR